MSGAFIIDPAGTEPEADRVFVITEWSSVTREQLREIVAQDDPGAAFLKLRPEVLFLGRFESAGRGVHAVRVHCSA